MPTGARRRPRPARSAGCDLLDPGERRAPAWKYVPAFDQLDHGLRQVIRTGGTRPGSPRRSPRTAPARRRRRGRPGTRSASTGRRPCRPPTTSGPPPCPARRRLRRGADALHLHRLSAGRLDGRERAQGALESRPMRPIACCEPRAAVRIRGITSPTTTPSIATTPTTVASKTRSTIAISTSAPMSITVPMIACTTDWIAIWRSSVVSAVTRASRSPGAWLRMPGIDRPRMCPIRSAGRRTRPPRPTA